MTTATLFGLCGALLVGLGLHGAIVQRELLRRIVSINLLGAGIFLVFGVVARRGAEGDAPADPVPQAMVITGIVVAFAATALGVALVRRLVELSGRSVLPDEDDEEGDA